MRQVGTKLLTLIRCPPLSQGEREMSGNPRLLSVGGTTTRPVLTAYVSFILPCDRHSRSK
jgi:hypothetical protein